MSEKPSDEPKGSEADAEPPPNELPPPMEPEYIEEADTCGVEVRSIDEFGKKAGE